MLRQRVDQNASKATKAEVEKPAKVLSVNKLTVDDVPEDKRFFVPNYTNKQLMDAIPAHCFERSALRSTMYMMEDILAIAFHVYLVYRTDDIISWAAPKAAQYYPALGSETARTIARWALWANYWIWSSFWGMGLWVVGHECGHQAFSSSKTINNSVGWVVHSFLLVPYHAWRISHGRHHASTGSLTRDEVFVPRTRSEKNLPKPRDEDEIIGLEVSHESQSALAEALDHIPLAIFWTAVYQLLGFPLYLFMNAAGQNRYPKWTNHFMPNSVIFRKNHKWQILWSDFGIFAIVAGLTYWSRQRSFTEMMMYYGIPYLLVNSHLIHITFLQHTDVTLPHYSDKVWTFPRGALSTIDRTFYWFVGTYMVHGLCETHVAHHICSKIPHYHAWEATEALKKFLGPHYHRSDENMLVSLWKSHRECRFIEDDVDVAFYKNHHGFAHRAGIMVSPPDSGVELSS